MEQQVSYNNSNKINTFFYDNETIQRISKSRFPIKDIQNCNGVYNVVQIHVEYQILMSAFVRREIIVSFLEFILFSRCQISIPIHLLRLDKEKWEKNDNSNSQKEKTPIGNKLRRQRRIEKLMGTLDRFHYICLSAMETGVDLVAIILGGILTSPREIYLIHFPPNDHDCTDLEYDQILAIRRKIVLSAIRNSVLPVKCTPTRTFVLFRALSPALSQIPGVHTQTNIPSITS